MTRRTLPSSRIAGLAILLAITLIAAPICQAQQTGKIRIPRRQSKPPGPAKTPQQALDAMTSPQGFKVELMASEPDIVNPVGMTIDERGRVWITESLEYPRRSPGKGRDRVKVLEDTNQDGKFDKVTIFADGLNIPSGIAVGYGGVFVANAPDLLFMQDTDGDGKADQSRTILTGFGRTDTHELPNSLTWGPDGWLYGLNGVFNHSHVKYAKDNPNYDAKHPGWRFTCAMFRIHPRTWEFQIFAEGTSNPWGIAWNENGSAFISACVIDHLWHITETGYYHRQGGPYPPHTWKLGSIVKHKHQKAAYCGITWLDSDAYPQAYRGKLYMGNIHGGCINSDGLTRAGASYFGKPRPDFMTANDPWFMPVVQKTGPDGCLWVLDWYDRYHCYQDANADPKGIDRLHGRLYRVTYKGTPPAPKFDLARENDESLIKRLHSPNVFFRETAQRLLSERLSAGAGDSRSPQTDPQTTSTLSQLVLDRQAPRHARLHALWALVGAGPLPVDLSLILLEDDDPTFAAWAVRAAGNAGREATAPAVIALMNQLAGHAHADVLLQIIIAATKLHDSDQAVTLMTRALAASGDDALIPHIVWQNLHPLLPNHGARFLAEVRKLDLNQTPNVAKVMPRVTDRILGLKTPDPAAVAQLVNLMHAQGQSKAMAKSLVALAERVQTGQVTAEQLADLQPLLQPVMTEILKGSETTPTQIAAVMLAATWRDPAAIQAAHRFLNDQRLPEAVRVQALDALIAADDRAALSAAAAVLADESRNQTLLRGVIASLSRSSDPRVGQVVVGAMAKLPAPIQPVALELLTQRTAWAATLLDLLEQESPPIQPDALNLNQVRKLASMKDQAIADRVKRIWGSVRMQRDPDREKVIDRVRQIVKKTPGDPIAGRAIFTKTCAQCHLMHGQGQQLGPDITNNGRSNFTQLLSNVLDPNLVIGDGYRARLVETQDGRQLVGLIQEENDQRIVLKLQGGKTETIPRRQVLSLRVSPLSLMPEGLEKGLSDQQIADLFAFLSLDKAPEDPEAQVIPGVR